MSTAAADVPSDIKALVDNVLKVYASKDGKEQGAIVRNNYRDDAHFVDPLMDTKGHEEIALAFYSLVKIFKDVDVTTKNIKLLPAHSLPKQLQPGNYQQVEVHNEQIYHFAQSGFLGKWLFPERVDLDVTTTFTLDPQLGKIVWHHDVWNNKGFGVLSFMKRPNGAFSGAIFKALGWKKDVYANQ